MDAAEVEFLAEKELVTIIPNFSLDKIYLIGGDLGPFNPGLPVQVPLWLAINLKQRQKCRLLPPEWMDVEKLEKIRDNERMEQTFTPMPSPYYMELTKLLLNHASDNIPKADEIRTLIKDVWDTRIAKLRVSADSFVRQQEAHAKGRPTEQPLDLVKSFLWRGRRGRRLLTADNTGGTFCLSLLITGRFLADIQSKLCGNR